MKPENQEKIPFRLALKRLSSRIRLYGIVFLGTWGILSLMFTLNLYSVPQLPNNYFGLAELVGSTMFMLFLGRWIGRQEAKK